jgi:hypothetical protein
MSSLSCRISNRQAKSPTFKLLTISKITLAVASALSFVQVQAGTTTQNVTFNSVGQSMWGSGNSIAFSNLDDPLFLGYNWDKSGQILKIGDPTAGGNGVKLTGSTSGEVGLELGWNVDSGTINSSLPFSFTLLTPDRNELTVGQTFDFGVSSASLNQGAFIRSVSPTIQAYADLIFKMDASLTATGCYNAIFTSDCGTKKLTNFIDIDNTASSLGRELLSVNIGADRAAAEADGQIRVLDGFKPLIAAGTSAADLNTALKDDGIDDSGKPDGSAPPPKTEKTSVTPKPKVSIGLSELASVSAKLPEIDALGLSAGGQTVGNSGLSNAISSNASDAFLTVDFDVDTAATLLGISPPLGAEVGLDFGVGSVSASIDLVDITLSPTLSLTQDLSLSINNISVSYLFDDGRAAQSASKLTDKIDVLWTGNALNITPVYNIAATVTNDTGLSVDFDFSIDLFKGSASAEVLGFDLGEASFGPLAQINQSLGGFTIPKIFDSSFALGGFSETKGADVSISISQAQFKSGLGDWESSSSWTGIPGKPTSTTDVQLGQTGTGAYASHAEIDDCSSFCATDQSEVVGNVTIKAGSRLDIGGKNYTFNNDNSIANKLSIKGNKLDNDGAIYVYTEDQLSFSSAAATSVSGTGNIFLRDGGILNTDGGGRATVNVSGQNINVFSPSSTNYTNKIANLNLNLSEGAAIVMNSDSRLLLDSSTVINNGTTQSLSGQTSLNNATLVNFDNANVVYVISQSNTSNASTWGAGSDGLLLNNGLVAVRAANNSSANLNLASGKSEAGVGTVLKLTNNDQVVINSLGGAARLNMTSDRTELSGAGEFVLLGNNAIISSDNINNRLINGAEHTLRGAGKIEGFRNSAGGLVNQGQVIAQNGTLDLTGNRVTNNGVMQALGGALLKLDATDMTQVTFNSGGGLFDAFDRMRLGAGGTYTVENGGTINFHTGNEDMERFANYAVLELNGANANITLTDSASIFGGSTTRNLDELSQFDNYGTLKLVNHVFAEDDFVNFFEANDFNNYGDVFLTNSRIKGVSNRAGGLIEGFGTIEGGGDLISGQLVNSGIIRAAGVGQTLRIELPDSIVSTWRNDGRVEVMNGANLQFIDKGIESFFSNGDTFSGGGTWAAYAGDQLTKIQFDAGSAFGNGVTKLDNVELILSGNNAQFFTVSNGQSKALKDTLTTINGSATLALENGKNFVASNVLTNNGTIRLETSYLTGNAINNNGQIIGSGGLYGGTLTNNGLVRAQSGFLDIAKNIDNQNGVIEVGSGGRNAQGGFDDVLRLNAASISGGELVVKDNALFQGVGSLVDVKLTNRGRVITSADFNSLSLQLAENSTNTGVLGADNGGSLILSGADLNNAGGVVLVNNANLRMIDVAILSGNVEITGANAALRGYGSLDNVEIKVSNGAIIADVNGKRLTLNPSQAAQLLNATLSAENGGILLLTDGQINGQGGTVIRASHGSIVELKNIVISGAQFQTLGTGKFVDVASSHFTNMNFTGNMEVADGGEFNLYGFNRLTGSLTALTGGEIVLHDTTVAGQTLESVTNADGSISLITKVMPGDLNINAGSVVHGSGKLIDLNITNEGTIHSNTGGLLEIDNAGSEFVNNGRVEASNSSAVKLADTSVINQGDVVVQLGSEINFADKFEQTAGSTLIEGTMGGGTLILTDGTLSGTGQLLANLDVGLNASLFVNDVKVDSRW